MTFTELATELCNRCGEGYQDYVNPAKEMLYQAFDTLILNGLATEDEYFGLIKNTGDKDFSSTFDFYSVIEDDANIFIKLLAVKVDNVKVDQLTPDEYNVSSRISALIGSPSYYFNDGILYFVNVPTVAPVSVSLSYVKRYKEASALDNINKYISTSFAEKALELAQPKLYAEINS